MPHTLVQFWDAPEIPSDVRRCMGSWCVLERRGFVHRVFDDVQARQYIEHHFTEGHLRAFDRCHHPAMRSDYFRLCFIARHGGFYVDADEVFQGVDCESLMHDSRLKLQPLCYDSASDSMVQALDFTRPGACSPSWTMYVANDPLIAPPCHPVVLSALTRATERLLDHSAGRPDIQVTTGPGNLTTCLIEHALTLE